MLVSDLRFGIGENSTPYVGDGWSHPEVGFTWSMGPESFLVLPVLDTSKPHLVMLDVTPLTYHPDIKRQRLTIYLGNDLLEATSLHRQTMIAFRIVASSGDSCPYVIRFSHPDHFQPDGSKLMGESRPLALMFKSLRIVELRDHLRTGEKTRPAFPLMDTFKGMQNAVESTVGIPISDLLMQFESLGHTCEFGLLQQQFGADQLSLLRFTGIDAADLVRGVLARLVDLGRAEAIALNTPIAGGEIWAHELLYNLHCHTGFVDGQSTPASIVQQQAIRLSFLKRKFLEDIDDRTKIFVLKRPEPITMMEAMAVFAALNAHGPNTLLWLETDGGGEPGRVELLMPGLMRGYLDRVNDHSSPETWLSVCANAYSIWKEGADASAHDSRTTQSRKSSKMAAVTSLNRKTPGQKHFGRRQLIIYGDCQSEGLYKAFQSIPEVIDKFDLIWHWAGLQHNSYDEWSEHAATTHFLIMQDITLSAVYPTNRSLSRPGRTLMYPSLYFGSLWPFADDFGAKDTTARAISKLNGDYSFDFYDSCLARLRSVIADPNLRYTAYRYLKDFGLPELMRFFSRLRFTRMLELEAHKFEQADHKYGLNVGRFILANFRLGPLFHSATHPSARVFVPLAFELLGKIGVSLQPRRIDMEHLSHFEVPVHPVVATQLGLAWATESRKYHCNEHLLTFEDYTRKYIDTFG